MRHNNSFIAFAKEALPLYPRQTTIHAVSWNFFKIAVSP
jgi:hypothetical protein